MRSIVTTTTSRLFGPAFETRKEAAKCGGDLTAHDRFLAEWSSLNAIERVEPAQFHSFASPLNVAAWNLERCKHVEASADLLAQMDADVVLATEMDFGMARSFQRHTTRDLAQALNMGWLYGVEFVELGIGDDRERAEFDGVPNQEGLHGNAILSKFPLLNPALIPLDDGGGWFGNDPNGKGEFRVGGRMALGAQIETPSGLLTVVSMHFESESTPESRAIEADRVCSAIEELYGNGMCVMGGDLNTRHFTDGGATSAQILNEPQRFEPAFSIFEQAGFEWRTSNTGEITTRFHPWHDLTRPPKVLDWLFVRGLRGSSPSVVPAIDQTGQNLSDHELIGVEIVV